VRALLVAAGGAVRRYLFGMCGDWDRAEDLAQEALLRAWQKRATFDGRSQLQTWVFAIARNCFLDGLRWQRANPRQEPMSQELPSRLSEPPDAAARGELVQAVARAVDRLPAEQREALALRESEGLTFAQIGQLLGVPPSTVKSRVRYALLKLAEELEPFQRELEP
jgi:RNA polymerase sigma-70 factor (ECF subfamily)